REPADWKVCATKLDLELILAQQLPDPQRLRCGPGLRVAAALPVGCVAINDLRQLSQATFVEHSGHAAQVKLGRGNGRRLEIPRPSQRFAEHGESPGPGGAIVIRRLALAIFVTL